MIVMMGLLRPVSYQLRSLNARFAALLSLSMVISKQTSGFKAVGLSLALLGGAYSYYGLGTTLYLNYGYVLQVVMHILVCGLLLPHYRCSRWLMV